MLASCLTCLVLVVMLCKRPPTPRPPIMAFMAPDEFRTVLSANPDAETWPRRILRLHGALASELTPHSFPPRRPWFFVLKPLRCACVAADCHPSWRRLRRPRRAARSRRESPSYPPPPWNPPRATCRPHCCRPPSSPRRRRRRRSRGYCWSPWPSCLSPSSTSVPSWPNPQKPASLKRTCVCDTTRRMIHPSLARTAACPRPCARSTPCSRSWP